MSSLIEVLNSVVKGENHFCCLCFNIDQSICLHDELTIEINETGQNIAVTDILQSVFGDEMQEYLATFENICEDCLKNITSIYSFIQKSHSNATLLMNALDGLNNSVMYTNEDNRKSKSLFVWLNLEDFSSKHLYDSKNLDSTKAALRRLNSLNASTKEIPKEKEEPLKSKSKRKQSCNIKISDMLLDPNNEVEQKCKICFKSYMSLWELKNHFIKVHTSKFICPKCPKVFKSRSLVDYHINDDHCEIVCYECGKTLKNKNAFLKHEMGHHQTLVCPDCGRTYKSKVTYKNHIELNVCQKQCRANPANAQFTCDHCGKKYTQKMSLRVHIQYEHGNYKSHICEWCGKKFWAHSRLKAHIVKHTGEKKFTCSICQGKYATKESLLYHTRLHTGEKPYMCSECECTFISASRRAYHMKTYHLGATLKCEICNAKFTSYIYLDKHKKCHKQQKINDNNQEIQRSNEYQPKKKESKLLRKKVKILNETSIPNNSASDNMVMPTLIREQSGQYRNHRGNKTTYQEHCDEVFMTTDSGDKNLCIALGI